MREEEIDLPYKIPSNICTYSLTLESEPYFLTHFYGIDYGMEKF